MSVTQDKTAPEQSPTHVAGDADFAAQPSVRVPAKPNTTKLDRRALRRTQPQSIHARRNWSKAEVYTIQWPPGSGERVVVKDMRRCPLWFRLVVGRRFMAREAHVLRSLSGVGIAPELVSQPDADSLVMTLCEGTPARDFKKRTLPLSSLERIAEVITGLHARGITHGDLHASNILVDGERITLIDWATAHEFGAGPRGLKGWLFGEWRGLDRRQLAKLRLRHAPQTLSPQEQELLMHGGSGAYRFVRQIGYLKDRLRGKRAKTRATVREEERRKVEDALSVENASLAEHSAALGDGLSAKNAQG